MMKNQNLLLTDNDIGFDVIYKGHDRRTWANYWSPLLSATFCTITAMVIMVFPVITTARPGKSYFFNGNLKLYKMLLNVRTVVTIARRLVKKLVRIT